ncbi:Helix-turn-helix domain-containing protein [Pseudarcicella hirudinis]|uniref:Helix-turn-helix domain-containing protein n=1 Tax=Pseudarcicella hirudinis TaxID=1079859 RepID=A0A1I5TWG6_9BACT|nr:helix-turn-helix transcriptional regulator [Pseudarcicella hirudinis]SFP87432.1 Helix-turn-helix domain-containing protein [Pseudarcicella hirudinis]
MTNTATPKNIHQGRNVKRFREMMGIKQDALAADLGDDWNQQKISLLEQKETIDAPLLAKISNTLKIPVEAIQNFDEQSAVNIIAQTINNHDQSASVFYNPVFNPLDEIKKLHEEKIALYERMLKEKEEMMGRLERLIEKK